MSFESPLTLVVNEIASEIAEKFDGSVLTALKKYDVDVNKDELIKALRYDRDQYEKGYADGYADCLKEDRWISVKDRLPDKDGLYLCWTLFNGVEYHYQINLWKDDSWYWVHDVHYWMPLPEPPMEVTE